MPSESTVAAPVEQGQIVQVRNRRYAVVDVVPGSRAGQNIVNETPQTLVRLASVEDDGIGEELSVIWELEPGARVFSRGMLPEPTDFDSPTRFSAFMNAVRWGVISAAASKELQAPFRASLELEDYQLEPLVRALQMPRVNLLIADDVGLGKTIESGLIAYELLLRHRIRRILVVCPASLQVQWHEQMRDKFGLDFRIVNGNMMQELRRTRGLHVNPWNHYPRLITSIDYLKRERPMRLFREALPGPDEDLFPRRFDLLIVDEAHNVAPPGTGRYATDSQRTQAIRTLAPHFEHRLFLTATPHNGYSESFSSLLELLDDQRFARGVAVDQKQVRSIMIRRLKSEIVHPVTGKPLFPKRQLIPMEIDYTEEERQAHADLSEYSKKRRETGSPTERVAVEFVLKLLKKRLFSSPAAFASTLEKHAQSAGKQIKKRKTTVSRRATESILRRHIDRLEEEFGDDDEFDVSTEEALEVAGAFFRELTKEEQELLDSLQKYANHAAVRVDSKAKKLIGWIKDELQTDGEWNDRRLLIFTEYRDTQKWLLDLFSQHGFLDDERTLSLHGGMQTEDREAIKAAFQADPAISAVRILLATDAASEGVDLQNHCSRLVHVEIPWNPNRLEQRNGRLDRHGQKADRVQVFHFVGAGYDKPQMEGTTHLEADLEFLFRAARKIETIREDLGKVGPVIARQVSDAMLGEKRRLDTQEAEAGGGAVRKLLKWERDLKKQIEDCHRQAEATQHDLRIFPGEMKAVVDTALKLAGKPPLRNDKLKGVWPGSDYEECPVFQIPESLSGSWARTRDGLAHPHTQEIRPITFDPEIARRRDDVVHAHLNHPLLRLSANLLRAEIWSPVKEKKLNRITGVRVPRGIAHNVSILLHSRLLVLGNDQERLQEELLLAGGELAEGKFRRIGTQQKLADLAQAVSEKEISPGSKKIIQDAWPVIHQGLEKALDARIKDRTKNMDAELQRRMEREVKDITEILEELKTRIEAELKREEDPQLLLQYNDLEQSQFRKDREHLQRRLARIPDEMAQERKKIEDRYQNIQSRVFPVGVTVLFPENLDR